MHAVVATVAVSDPQVAREALASLRLSLVPRAPGFVSAYRLEPIGGTCMSVIVGNSYLPCPATQWCRDFAERLQ